VRLASDDMREQRIAAVDCGIERRTTVKENTSVALHGRKKKEAERLDYAALASIIRIRLFSDSRASDEFPIRNSNLRLTP
jgi:hypothetical protein